MPLSRQRFLEGSRGGLQHRRPRSPDGLRPLTRELRPRPRPARRLRLPPSSSQLPRAPSMSPRSHPASPPPELAGHNSHPPPRARGLLRLSLTRGRLAYPPAALKGQALSGPGASHTAWAGRPLCLRQGAEPGQSRGRRRRAESSRAGPPARHAMSPPSLETGAGRRESSDGSRRSGVRAFAIPLSRPRQAGGLPPTRKARRESSPARWCCASAPAPRPWPRGGPSRLGAAFSSSALLCVTFHAGSAHPPLSPQAEARGRP